MSSRSESADQIESQLASVTIVSTRDIPNVEDVMSSNVTEMNGGFSAATADVKRLSTETGSNGFTPCEFPAGQNNSVAKLAALEPFKRCTQPLSDISDDCVGDIHNNSAFATEPLSNGVDSSDFKKETVAKRAVSSLDSSENSTLFSGATPFSPAIYSSQVRQDTFPTGDLSERRSVACVDTESCQIADIVTFGSGIEFARANTDSEDVSTTGQVAITAESSATHTESDPSESVINSRIVSQWQCLSDSDKAEFTGVAKPSTSAPELGAFAGSVTHGAENVCDEGNAVRLDDSDTTSNVDVVVHISSNVNTAGGRSTSVAPLDQDGSISADVLREKLRRQLEYCFSVDNLSRDTYMHCQMDEDQFIPIHLIAQFNMVRSYTHSLELVTDILREIPSVEVDAAGLKARRVNHRSTLILREVPASTPPQDVEALFRSDKCPPIVSCEFIHNDYWYITFESSEDAQQAYRYLHEDVKEFLGKPILARIKTKATFSSTVPVRGNSYNPAAVAPPQYDYPTVAATPATTMMSGPVVGAPGVSPEASLEPALPYAAATVQTVSYLQTAPPQNYPFFPPQPFLSSIWPYISMGGYVVDPSSSMNYCFSDAYASYMSTLQQPPPPPVVYGPTHSNVRHHRKDFHGGAATGGQSNGGTAVGYRHHERGNKVHSPLERNNPAGPGVGGNPRPHPQQHMEANQQPPRFNRQRNNQDWNAPRDDWRRNGGEGGRNVERSNVGWNADRRFSASSEAPRPGRHVGPNQGPALMTTSVGNDAPVVTTTCNGENGAAAKKAGDRGVPSAQDGGQRNGGIQPLIPVRDTRDRDFRRGGNGGGYRGGRRRNFPDDGSNRSSAQPEPSPKKKKVPTATLR